MVAIRFASPPWYPDWHDEQCIIVASGPSALGVPLELARGKAKFIAINDAWQLAPWADMLYACDARWWRAYEGLTDFPGVKVTQDQQLTEAERWGIEWVRADRRSDVIMTKPGVIGWGGNSGFQAINLAVQFGVNKIILVGFDMRLDRGIHWNGPHQSRHKPLNDPTPENVQRWRRAVDGASLTLAELGIAVINCSQESALMNYAKMPFEEALELKGAVPDGRPTNIRKARQKTKVRGSGRAIRNHGISRA